MKHRNCTGAGRWFPWPHPFSRNRDHHLHRSARPYRCTNRALERGPADVPKLDGRQLLRCLARPGIDRGQPDLAAHRLAQHDAVWERWTGAPC